MTINSSGGFVAVSLDKLSVKYTGLNLHDHDFGIVQANKPAPIQCFGYTLNSLSKMLGLTDTSRLVFTTKNTKIMRRPGWEDTSCSYHGDIGLITCRQENGDTHITSPTYTTNDTVGAGTNYASQDFFFTKNGDLVGTVPKVFTAPLFPTVALHSQNEESDHLVRVIVNFGSKTFAFDFKKYVASERKKQLMEIEKTSISPSISHGLLKTYFLHYGYGETLNAFNLGTESAFPSTDIAKEGGFDEQEVSFALQDRKNLRELIMMGRIDAAIAQLRVSYPQLVQNDKSEVCFLLHCQKFIELVRDGELEEAVNYGRLELAKFIGLTVFEEIVKDCFALLAYQRPQESVVGYFLGDMQKEVVADAVNAAILSTNANNNDPLHSCLERLIRQLTTCSLLLRSLKNDQGETFSLHKLLNNNS